MRAVVLRDGKLEVRRAEGPPRVVVHPTVS
jgi:hypothetical protein